MIVSGVELSCFLPVGNTVVKETGIGVAVRYSTFGVVKGFTLLEVLVVMGIVVMLSSIAWPHWQKHVTSSQQAVLVANIHSMSFFQESYKLRRGTYAVGLAGRDEISSTLGWVMEAEDGTTYEIIESDGSFYQVVAIDSYGVSVCLHMPSRQQC